jgi:hypothetical protein
MCRLSRRAWEKIMAAAAFLALVLNAHQPAIQPVHQIYRPPLASIELLVDNDSVRVLNARNVGVSLRSSEYTDLDISHSFHVACALPMNYGLWRVRAWADSVYNLLPVTIVEYKYYDPTYVELEIEPSTFTDAIDGNGTGLHRVHIEFYTRD